MNKYLEQESAIESICSRLDWTDMSGNPFPREDIKAYVKSLIDPIPAADVRPVVRGKWVDESIKGVRYHCSVCQGRFDYTWHYCPNCGADMREES